MNETVTRHPVLGLLAGLLLGLGVVLMLFVFGVVPMTVVWLGVAVGGGAVLGALAAYVVPARRPY